MSKGHLQHDVSLEAFTTLRTPAKARWFAEVADVTDLRGLLQNPPGERSALILGEGSNCLFTRDYDGLVIHMANLGVQVVDEERGLVRAEAGENWHRFLRWTLAQGFAGLENLALIPGTVGAAPIQNIGAYGVEVERFIHAVHAIDTGRGKPVELERDACGFAYRDSIFKQHPGRFVITAVSFALPRTPDLQLDYSGLRERLADRGNDDPSPTDVADAVESLRREKLPDPAVLGNAGSFFKNPVVDPGTSAALLDQHPDMPTFDVVGGRKLSAGWLIEKAGMKGYRIGDAGISDRHALVLVNYGSATGEQLWAVAMEVREKVGKLFGIDLEPEPRVY